MSTGYIAASRLHIGFVNLLNIESTMSEFSLNARRSRFVRLRRGLSILEVMISVGVAVIGLLGVLALLPVASRLAQQGLNEDRKTAAGVAALEEFNVRGMANDAAWRRWGNNLATPVFVGLRWWPEGANDSVWGTNNGGMSSNGDDDDDGIIDEFDEAAWPSSDDAPLNYVPAQPVCIDPRLVTRVRMNSPKLDHGFPLTLSQSLQIPRVTILDTESLPDGTLLTPAQGVLVADRIFHLDDDLVFNTPKDTTLAPLQQYVYNMGPDAEWGVAGVDDRERGDRGYVEGRDSCRAALEL